MFKKYLIIASKKDKAGINITTQLSQFNQDKFKFYLVEDEIIHTKNLDMEKINRFDFVIFASKHKSAKSEKTLSVHAPGNWLSTTPIFGGQPEKVCPSSALFQKSIFENLNKNSRKYNLDGKYKITLECTHHGPLIEKPCLFIEIGSTEEEYKDRKAGFIIAKTISETIENFKENPYHEIAIGIGGPHYCPNFTKIQLNSNLALSHIIPQYVFPLKEEMLKESVKKTYEEADLILIDWKGLGNSEQRKQALEILDSFYLPYKRTSDISK